MRYVAAYLLAALGGNEKPSAADLKKIMSSVGVSVDDAELDKVISELAEKTLAEVIEAGKEKLAAVPSGAAVANTGATGAATGSTEAAEPEPEEEEEESDDDMDGFSLFD
jgi:large subunit ribosomal protein LP2